MQYQRLRQSIIPDTFLRNIVYILGAFAIAGMVLGIASISISSQKTGLKLSTDYELSDGSYHAINSIPCTNKSLGNQHRTFRGDTYLGIPCPKSDNPCVTFVCGEDGFCTSSPEGECYVNSQCNTTSSCNLTTCTCDANIVAECATDSDCPDFSANPCIENKCISNQCVPDLVDGGECSSSTQCSEDFYCNSTCLCTDTASILGWSVYSPTVDQDLSNIALENSNFFDGVYYRIGGGYVEVQFYLQCRNSTNNSISKELTIDAPPGVMLDTDTNGDGVFTIAALATFLADTTVYSGSGSAYIASSTSMTFFSVAFNQPTAGSTTFHYISATFLGKLV